MANRLLESGGTRLIESGSVRLLEPLTGATLPDPTPYRTFHNLTGQADYEPDNRSAHPLAAMSDHDPANTASYRLDGRRTYRRRS